MPRILGSCVEVQKAIQNRKSLYTYLSLYRGAGCALATYTIYFRSLHVETFMTKPSTPKALVRKYDLWLADLSGYAVPLSECIRSRRFDSYSCGGCISEGTKCNNHLHKDVHVE